MQYVDVKPVGINGTDIGFSTVNVWFHSKTGTNMFLYNITDCFGLVPIFICVIFGLLGLTQWIKRKNIFKVDKILIVMGCYYVIVILCYLFFEIVPINYRPILINGKMESSYPSSTTMLVTCVMPTAIIQLNRRVKNGLLKKIFELLISLFIAFMVIGRFVSGVHWFSDILGGLLYSIGMVVLYCSVLSIIE